MQKPDWLKIKINNNSSSQEVAELLKKLSLHTVCEEANCPNLNECFGRKTATFMILGNICTRNCTFCNVTKGQTLPLDNMEPKNVAQAVEELKLKHVVVTSVTRDDLEDGGSGQFAKVIKAIKSINEKVIVEVLIPDFGGQIESLDILVGAKPDIINHNIETVSRLYPTVRPMAIYERSLDLLRNVKLLDEKILTKSGIMVGLGEKSYEVLEVLKDLRENGCDILTIGQYFAPSVKHHPVVEYVTPGQFDFYRKRALELEFRSVAAGPFIRSSYLAEKSLEQIKVGMI